MIRRPPRSTPLYSSAASDVYKRQLPIYLSTYPPLPIYLFIYLSIYLSTYPSSYLLTPLPPASLSLPSPRPAPGPVYQLPLPVPFPRPFFFPLLAPSPPRSKPRFFSFFSFFMLIRRNRTRHLFVCQFITDSMLMLIALSRLGYKFNGFFVCYSYANQILASDWLLKIMTS